MLLKGDGLASPPCHTVYWQHDKIGLMNSIYLIYRLSPLAGFVRDFSCRSKCLPFQEADVLHTRMRHTSALLILVGTCMAFKQ